MLQKSETTQQMRDQLNARFNTYGIYIEKLNVTNVIIPKDLRHALMQATTYDVFLQNQLKYQENLRLKMMNQENMQLKTLNKDNQKKMLELNNTLAMEEIFLQKFKVNTETDQQIKILNANKNQEIKTILNLYFYIYAQAMRNQAEQRAKRLAEEILAEARAYSEGKRVTILAIKAQLGAQTRFECAQLRIEGLLKEADSEADHANNLQSKRKHEQRMLKTDILIIYWQSFLTDNLRMLMKEMNVIIGGENAELLLDYFNETNRLVDDPNE